MKTQPDRKGTPCHHQLQPRQRQRRSHRSKCLQRPQRQCTPLELPGCSRLAVRGAAGAMARPECRPCIQERLSGRPLEGAGPEDRPGCWTGAPGVNETLAVGKVPENMPCTRCIARDTMSESRAAFAGTPRAFDGPVSPARPEFCRHRLGVCKILRALGSWPREEVMD